MSDELLPYYRRELAYLRSLGAEFAEAYPKIAARLQLGPETYKDPHVERLVEAFAYLTARVRHKLDDDFPEIAESFLQVVCPHYVRPIPSAAIAEFGLDPQQAELLAGHTVPPEAGVETDPIDGEPCRFRTCYPVRLWPVSIRSVTFQGSPLPGPAQRFPGDAQSVVRIELQCASNKIQFSQLPLESLRFFLHGPTQFSYDLYELMLNQAVGVALANSDQDKQPKLMSADSLQPVGLEPDEGILPASPRAAWAYRLLSEYFAFPEKFLFVDLKGLTADRLAGIGNQLVIYVYLNRYVRDLERHVSRESLRLGCTPIVNLFRHLAQPIDVTQTQSEYHIIPDPRRPAAFEVHSVERVRAITSQQEEVEFHPFYAVKHGGTGGQPRSYWHATRRQASFAGGQVDRGTEVYLHLVDLDFQPMAPADGILQVELTCGNRDLPQRLPFGGGQPGLHLLNTPLVTRVSCLTPPTATLRPSLRHGILWKLISHLSVNHLSLVDEEHGADALREILTLYDFLDSAETRRMIEGVVSVSGRRVVGRVGGPVSGGFCRGTEVHLHLDEDKFTGASAFLFASVLERFLGQYCTINSFTKLIATTNKRETPLRKWPPRASNRIVL